MKHKGNHPGSDELTESSESPSRPQLTANWGCMTGLCNAMKPTAQKQGDSIVLGKMPLLLKALLTEVLSNIPISPYLISSPYFN